MRYIKGRFQCVDYDIQGRERLFFDNAGGSFRLKTATEALLLPMYPHSDGF